MRVVHELLVRVTMKCNYYTFFYYLNFVSGRIWSDVVLQAIDSLHHFNILRYIMVGIVHVLANKQ